MEWLHIGAKGGHKEWLYPIAKVGINYTFITRVGLACHHSEHALWVYLEYLMGRENGESGDSRVMKNVQKTAKHEAKQGNDKSEAREKQQDSSPMQELMTKQKCVSVNGCYTQIQAEEMIIVTFRTHRKFIDCKECLQPALSLVLLDPSLFQLDLQFLPGERLHPLRAGPALAEFFQSR